MVKTLLSLPIVVLIVMGMTYWMYTQLELRSSAIQRRSFNSDLQILEDILKSLKKSYQKNLPPSLELIQTLEAVIKQQDHVTLSKIKSIFSGNTLPPGVLDVWIRNLTKEGKNFGWPFFQNVIYFKTQNQCVDNLPYILDGWNRSYPSASIYVPKFYLSKCIGAKSYQNLKPVPIVKSWMAGKVWNQLVKAVSTPYILIGRDLNHFDNYSQVERQIRMISYIADIVVAGGSYRNQTGHWQVGCYQMNLKNYILEYSDGYYVSRNECMFCDHLLGPFITTKTLLEKVPFDETLPSYLVLVFENFFLIVKTAELGFVVNCLDAIYFSICYFSFVIKIKH